MKKIQSVEQVQDQHFDQHMQALVEHRVSPSLAVTAVRDSDTIVARGYGWSDLEQGTMPSAETVYLYCSMTKLFTATALMQLRERGLVDLDREVGAYLPDFPLHHPSGREITVRHLLSHSSGIAPIQSLSPGSIWLKNRQSISTTLRSGSLPDTIDLPSSQVRAMPTPTWATWFWVR